MGTEITGACSTLSMRARRSGIWSRKPGRDHRDLHLIAHALIQDRAEDDVGIFVGRRLNQRRRFIHFRKLQRSWIP